MAIISCFLGLICVYVCLGPTVCVSVVTTTCSGGAVCDVHWLCLRSQGKASTEQMSNLAILFFLGGVLLSGILEKKLFCVFVSRLSSFSTS